MIFLSVVIVHYNILWNYTDIYISVTIGTYIEYKYIFSYL